MNKLILDSYWINLVFNTNPKFKNKKMESKDLTQTNENASQNAAESLAVTSTFLSYLQNQKWQNDMPPVREDLANLWK